MGVGTALQKIIGWPTNALKGELCGVLIFIAEWAVDRAYDPLKF